MLNKSNAQEMIQILNRLNVSETKLTRLVGVKNRIVITVETNDKEIQIDFVLDANRNIVDLNCISSWKSWVMEMITFNPTAITNEELKSLCQETLEKIIKHFHLRLKLLFLLEGK